MSSSNSCESSARFTAPVYLDAAPLTSSRLTGIGRYTARLAIALAARTRLRLYLDRSELHPSPRLDWSHDQDLGRWARAVGRSPRSQLSPPAGSVGICSGTRNTTRRFDHEISIIHDLTPLFLPEVHVAATIRDFQRLAASTLLLADALIADSHATRADIELLTDVPPARIVVGRPGASLCVQRHLHPSAVSRRPEVGIMVATLEPRKNAAFLADWFFDSPVLPENAELWWVGSKGWLASKSDLGTRRSRGGRKLRLLGAVSDKELCRLYRTAGWMAYPSLYEGFGFPVLDALRHGVSVMCAGNSSLIEFEPAGVTFFDPLDPSSLDRCFERRRPAEDVIAPPHPLDEQFSWDRVVDLIASTAAGCSSRGETSVVSQCA
ncbi:MAG: glycosyltransferase [Isosphaeraceae bacterium]|nr:glycosyltransferase [Isosphaeraceae bacterium]